MVTDRITLMKNRRLAQEIAKQFEIDEQVQQAIENSCREAFVPSGFTHNAYRLDALPLGAEQWISSPLTVAKMTQFLQIDESVDSVLEVGCGSGYQAMVLAQMVRRVFTIERIETLLLDAKKRFRALGVNNIHTRYDDGALGWPSYAPYDRILFSATAISLPPKIIEQLAPRGILVAPMIEDNQEVIKRFVKIGDELFDDTLECCSFVPIVDGVQSK